MARTATLSEPSLHELERLVQMRRRELNLLIKKRTKIEKKVRALDERIRLIGGPGATKRGGRAKNELNLVDAIEGVLRSAGKPLGVGEIMQKVVASGYRSSSANFRGIVNQTLIKEKQFHGVSRGVYGLKR